jgi:hypothetical protein
MGYHGSLENKESYDRTELKKLTCYASALKNKTKYQSIFAVEKGTQSKSVIF